MKQNKYAETLRIVESQVKKMGAAKVYKMGMDEQLHAALKQLAEDKQWFICFPATNTIVLIDYLAFYTIQG